jgi:hypothetical protein
VATKRVLTVGNRSVYDKGIRLYGNAFQKTGRTAEYAGGFAVSSFADAQRLIDEFGKRGEWAVYELDADWDTDTVQSDNGWWHALLKDSKVLRKVTGDDWE